MLPKWLTALLVLLHEAWSARRDAHIRFLKLQVEMLKERLPGNRVILDPVERRRLMKIPVVTGCYQRQLLAIAWMEGMDNPEHSRFTVHNGCSPCCRQIASPSLGSAA